MRRFTITVAVHFTFVLTFRQQKRLHFHEWKFGLRAVFKVKTEQTSNHNHVRKRK